MYAKLVDSKTLEYAPNAYKTPSGGLILNFNKSVPSMVRWGFKIVVDIEPVYNKDTQYISLDKYVEDSTQIKAIYSIQEKVNLPKLIDDRVECLENDKLTQDKNILGNMMAVAEVCEMVLSISNT